MLAKALIISCMLARLQDSVLIIVDMQPSFLNAIHEKDRVLSRIRFIAEIALLLNVPVLATEQYCTRMGGTEESLSTLLTSHGVKPSDKMSFSCCGSSAFMSDLNATGKKQAVIVGIETHICVNQTAHHLLSDGFEVLVAADAVGSRYEDMYEIGLRRMADAGITIAHTESIAYEWLDTAENPKFKEALKLVKQYA